MTTTKRSPTVLAIGAHPDDIELGAGATLLQMSEAGWSVVLLVATSGRLGGDPATRDREQVEAAAQLQAELRWGGFEDGHVQASPATISMIESYIRQLQPLLVFVHWPEDTHQDHRNLARSVMSASRFVENLVFFEGPSSEHFEPTAYVACNGQVFESKAKLVRCHDSQMDLNGRTDFLRWMHDTARIRGGKRRCEFCEAFRPAWTSLFLPLRHEIGLEESTQESPSAVVRGERRGDDGSQVEESFTLRLDAMEVAVLGDEAVARWTGRTIEQVRQEEGTEEHAARIARLKALLTLTDSWQLEAPRSPSGPRRFPEGSGAS